MPNERKPIKPNPLRDQVQAYNEAGGSRESLSEYLGVQTKKRFFKSPVQQRRGLEEMIRKAGGTQARRLTEQT